MVLFIIAFGILIRLGMALRLIPGVILVYQSGFSRYPLIMSWALSQVKALGRIGGVIASAFGAFLVHAFI
jgi:hypothetical protein